MTEPCETGTVFCPNCRRIMAYTVADVVSHWKTSANPFFDRPVHVHAIVCTCGQSIELVGTRAIEDKDQGALKL